VLKCHREGPREATGGGGEWEPNQNSFARTGLCPKFNPESQIIAGM
jgi:hypothetical protein